MMSKCTRCHLHKTAKTVKVESRGSDKPIILCVGEAPGNSEDSDGFAFVGDAWRELKSLMDQAGIKQEWVRYTNIVRCVPLKDPRRRGCGVRTPEPDEIEACSPYLESEILKVKPVYIVPLGGSAARYMIPRAKAISGVRRRRWNIEFPSVYFRFRKMLKWLRMTDQMHLLPKDTHTEGQQRRALEKAESHGFPAIPHQEFTVWPTFHPSYVLRGGGEEARQYILEDLAYLTKRITGKDDVPWDSYVFLDSLEKVKSVYSKIKKAYLGGSIDYVALDVETTGLHRFLLPHGELLLFSISDRAGRAYTIPFNHPESPFWKDTISLKAIISMTNDLLELVPLVGHNIKFDIHWLNKVGIFPRHVAGDTYLAHWTWMGNIGEKKLETLATRHLGMISHKEEMEQALLDLPPWIPIEDQYEQLALNLTDYLARYGEKKHNPWAIEVDADGVIYRERHMGDVDIFIVHKYCCADADSTGRLHEKLNDNLAKDNLLEPHDKYIIPAIIPTVEMERHGVKIDLKRFAQVRKGMEEQRDAVQDWFNENYASDVANILSDMPDVKNVPKQIKLSSPRNKRVWLFDILKLPIAETTNKGEPSTNRGSLEEILMKLRSKLDKNKKESVRKDLEDKIDCVKKLQEYNSPVKELNSYVRPIPLYADLDNVVHAGFGVCTTETQRYNCKGVPPWHGIKRGSLTKECVIPLHDLGVILIADWSQQELRMLANRCNDEAMIKAFHDGKDIHTFVTAMCQGKSMDEVVKKDRSKYKPVSLGVAIGGRGVAAVASEIGVSKEKAKKIVDKYLDAFPSVRYYHKQQEKQAQRDGEVWSSWGFRRILDKRKYDKDDLRRRGINNPIQMDAAITCVNALTMVSREISARKMKSSIWATIHDSLCSSIYPGELWDYACMLEKIMVEWPAKNLDWLKVPLAIDFDIGVNWKDTLNLKLLADGLVEINGESTRFAKLKQRMLKWNPAPVIVKASREDGKDDSGNPTIIVNSTWDLSGR